MTRGVTRLARYWEQDRGLTILLLLLVLVVLIGLPLAQPGFFGRTFLSALFTLMLVSGVVAVSRRRWVGFAAGGLALVAVGMEWAGEWSSAPALEVAAALSAFACVATLAAVVLLQVLRAGAISIDRIVGAAAAYLLLGFAWGEMYRLVSALVPGAFVSAGSGPLDRDQFYYFSIVTLTTLGYGDLAPLHPIARSLAMLEALTGQLFPAILIARLVAMELMARTSR